MWFFGGMSDRDWRIRMLNAEGSAESRAEALLLRHLSKEQYAEYRKSRSFTVRGKRHSYRIHNRSGVNIQLLNRWGQENGRLCVRSLVPMIPLPDLLLTEKWRIECDEDAFLRAVAFV